MNKSAIIGMDGNCGYCLLGDNIQDGEVEFVCIDDAPDIHKGFPDEMRSKRWAMTQAYRKLCLRLNMTIPYYVSYDFGYKK